MPLPRFLRPPYVSGRDTVELVSLLRTQLSHEDIRAFYSPSHSEPEVPFARLSVTLTNIPGHPLAVLDRVAPLVFSASRDWLRAHDRLIPGTSIGLSIFREGGCVLFFWGRSVAGRSIWIDPDGQLTTVEPTWEEHDGSEA